MPDDGDGLKVGVGTVHFAAPLGIEHGVDPSPEMRKRARERGIAVKEGVAEDLPYPDACFDAVFMTTTLCYLDDPEAAFEEAFRVLRPSGAFVVGFIDRGGPLGRRYEERRNENIFYELARFPYGPRRGSSPGEDRLRGPPGPADALFGSGGNDRAGPAGVGRTGSSSYGARSPSDRRFGTVRPARSPILSV